MYRLGKRKHKNHGVGFVLSIIFVLLMGLGALYALTHLPVQTPTTTQNSPPSVHYVSTATTGKVHLDETLFSIDLPTGWKLASHQAAPYNQYTFQGTGSSEGARIINIYVDGAPANYAVNRVVAIQAQGASVSHDTVSDNCINFTNDTARNSAEAKAQGFTLSRWDSVDFYCDVGNYSRNVTGTSTQGSIDKLSVTGPKEGTHTYFFVYTDNNINADYTVFYSMLESFQAK